MFLCEPCHAVSGCGWPTELEGQGWGRCECCGEVQQCSDCHSYDFRNTKHLHTAAHPPTDACGFGVKP